MIRRRSLLKRAQVATYAVGREPLPVELPHGSDSVARITVHGGVRADQWKAVLMFIDGMNRDLPATDPVTEVTLRSVFPPVEVSVTILAITAHVGEHRIDVTFLATHAYVKATQGIPDPVMVKIRLREDRFPRRRRMTLVTSNFHRAVRTSIGRKGTGLLPC